MSTYETLKGLKVKFLSADTSGDRIQEGEIFYNSADFGLKAHISVGAWSAGTPIPATKRLTAGFGTQTAAISAGGSPIVATAFEYNGVGWTALASMNDAKHSFDGTGTTAAGLVCGGVTGSPAANNRTNQSEEWNGSAWAEGNNMNSSRSDSHVAGIQTAAVSAFGVISTSRTNKTEEYNGTSWSEVNNTPIAADGTRGSGTLTAGIFTGGDTPDRVTTTFLYDGTNWTTGNAMPQALSKHGASGTQTSALVFGGASPSDDSEVDAAIYDGTSWTQSGDMATGRQELNGASVSATTSLAIGGELQPGNSALVEEWTVTTQTKTAAAWSSGGNLNTSRDSLSGAPAAPVSAGLVFGGGDNTGHLTVTEEYDGTAWTESGDLNTAREILGGAGTQTAALAFGGQKDNPNANSNESEEYNGSSWTEGNNLNTARFLAGAGTQTAGLGFGGTGLSLPRTGATEEYDGTSWSEQNDLNAARGYLAGCGTQTAGLAMAGSTPTAHSTEVEEYNGTSWTNVNQNLVGRKRCGAGGIQTAALLFGGIIPALTVVVEGYDGTNWSTRPSMGTARYFIRGHGTSSSHVIACGGLTSANAANHTNATEEFNDDILADDAKTVDFD
jgi:hypothetical protein